MYGYYYFSIRSSKSTGEINVNSFPIFCLINKPNFAKFNKSVLAV